MSTITTIDIGSAANDGTGDPARTAFGSCNTNFSNLNTDKLENLSEDTTPQLGGMLDVNGNSLGDGTLELLSFSETASAVNEFTIANAATGNAPVLSATGGDTNIGITLTPKGTGDVTLGNFVFDGDATVGAGQDNYVLTYDNASGLIGLEAAAGGGLSNWEESGTTLQPTTAGYDLGSATNYLGNVYLGSGAGGAVYFPGSNDYIYSPSPGLVTIAAGNERLTIRDVNLSVTIDSDLSFGWSPSSSSSAGPDVELRRDAAGVARVDDAFRISDTGYTVATLPTGATGTIARVTDASSPTIGNTVTGGAAAAALVWYNGSNWTVIGV